MKSLIHFTFLFGFISFLLIAACSGSVEQKEESTGDAFVFRSYQMDLNAPKVEFTEMIDELRIVQLEETEESLLSYVSNVKQSEGYYYFVDRQEKNNAICFFSKQGKFVNKINREGEGPEEYQEIGSSWLSGDTLKVFDRKTDRLLSYNLSGEFLSTESLPHTATQVFPTESGYWLDISQNLVPDSAQFEIVHVNKGMDLMTYHLPTSSSFGPTLIALNNNFQPLDGRIVFKHNFKDTLYTVEMDKVEPFIHFDFGQDYLWSEVDLRTNNSAAFDAMQNSGKVWYFYTLVGEANILLFYADGFGKQKVMLIERETGEMVRINPKVASGEQSGFLPSFWDGDSFLVSISSLDLAEVLEALEPSQYSFEEGSSLDGIESSENPALVWVKFKMPNL